MGRLRKVRCCLLSCLAVVLVFVASCVFIPYGATDAVKWVANSDFACKLRELPEQKVAREDILVEMVVEDIGVSEIDHQPVVILKEKGGETLLPISIGHLEANAILVVLEEIQVPRPLSADLFCSMLDRMGASVGYIVINDLESHTFYASITINVDWRQVEIDARPSDAIAIALRVRAPVYVEKSVLDEAGIQFDHGAGQYAVLTGSLPGGTDVAEYIAGE
ncbi:MAG: bifunctional nuclease family protein [Dehalococcoidia bacterium]|nr:bifunctional nuclease family protein [Dehalococcoidia bacterium]